MHATLWHARNTLGALLLILGLGVLALAKPVPPISAQDAEKKKIAELIEQLGSTKFQEWSTAAKALQAIGEPALPLLKKARAASDSQASKIANNLVRRIEEKLFTPNLPIPNWVHIKMEGVPVVVAVNELSRLSGYTIKVQGDQDKLEGKKITLDTGEVTFWEAFDKLCDQAGLMEPLSAPSGPSMRNKKPGEVVPKDALPAPAQIPIKFQAQPVPPIKLESKAPVEIIVVPGSSRNRQVSYAGSIRVRLYSRATAKPGEYQLILEASAEPRLQTFDVVSPPTLEKVIDEHGQNLAAGAQIMPSYNPSPRSIILGLNANQLRSIQPRVLRQQMEMRFKAGEKRAKTLKVFAGKLAVRVNAPPETLLTVKNVLNSAGESVKRPNGDIIKLDKIEILDNGDCKVKLSFEKARSSRGEGINVGGMMIQKLRDGDGNDIGFITTPGLPELVDAAGNKYQPVKIPFRRMSNSDGTGTQEIVIIYRADDGQGIPDRLVVSASRPVEVSFPIVFRDVPLE